MKIFIKSLLIAIGLIFVSCETDKEPVVSAGGLLLKSPTAGTSYVLTPQTAADDLITLQWDQSNNGVPSISTYTIEIAKSGTNFANPVVAVQSSDIPPTESYTWTVGYLNSLLNIVGFSPCEQLDIDIRVKSTLGSWESTAFVQYSNIITIKVTPFSLALPLISFAETSQNPATAPKLAASGLLNSDYEGYMWLEPGQYKFYQPDGCGSFTSPTIYGDDNNGTFTLTPNGAPYQVSTPGYYLVKADLSPGSLSYSVRSISWYIIGTGKTGFEQALNAPLVYDPLTKLLKATITLKNGYGIKFRSSGVGSAILYLGKNNGTFENYVGPILSYVTHNPTANPPVNADQLAVPGPRTTPVTTAVYEVVLDLGDPRNYNYSITLQP